MAQFKIITDTTADLPISYITEHDIGLVYLGYMIDGEDYGKDNQLDWKEFYALMRSGKMPTTSQVNPEQAKNYYEECIKENKNILHIAFSSGLSGSYNSAVIAAQEIMEEHPDCNIRVIDSLSASLGEGLLVHKAVKMQQAGKSLDEVYEWVRANIHHLVHVFTVDDLNHLYRGGRVSKVSAIVGTLASIKPLLHVDDEGHLTSLKNIRTRKKALMALVDYMEEKMGNFREQNDIIFISHGDSLADAEIVQEEVRKRFGIDSFLINHVSPTIGAHSGPGTIALFFMGDYR